MSGEATRFWVEDQSCLRDRPTCANIAYPDEAVEVVLAADYDRIVAELRETANVLHDRAEKAEAQVKGYADRLVMLGPTTLGALKNADQIAVPTPTSLKVLLDTLAQAEAERDRLRVARGVAMLIVLRMDELFKEQPDLFKDTLWMRGHMMTVADACSQALDAARVDGAV